MTDAQEKSLPTDAPTLLARLDALGIAYDLHEHEPVFTVAESARIDAVIPGLHCRNLFLYDKQKRHYLVCVSNDTLIDLKKLAPLIGAGRLSFGSAERLWEHLGVRPGSVCPFSIVNDPDRRVEIFLDKSMMDADLVCFHPMENHLTVGLSPRDLVRFVEACGHVPHITDLAPAAPSATEEEK